MVTWRNALSHLKDVVSSGGRLRVLKEHALRGTLVLYAVSVTLLAVFLLAGCATPTGGQYLTLELPPGDMPERFELLVLPTWSCDTEL